MTTATLWLVHCYQFIMLAIVYPWFMYLSVAVMISMLYHLFEPVSPDDARHLRLIVFSQSFHDEYT